MKDRTDEFDQEIEAEDAVEDDGRVIVNMNVEGMPGYRPNKPEQTKQGTGSDLSPRETRQYIMTAMLTALGVGLVFGIGIILFVLFCTNIWFA